MVILLVCISTVFASFGVFGLPEETGVEATPGLSEDVRATGEDVEGVSADREPGSEFTGGILGSITQVLKAFDLLYGAADAPGNLGFDPRLGILLGMPITFIVSFALYSAVRGRDA
jgi:hypothetical protein